MRITFPHLGQLYIFWRALLGGLGLEAVPPPFSSQRTLDLGARYCPEMTCAPCKLIFGNYLEALERGADAVLFFGGYDACRLGYSMPWQAQLLREMGFEFRDYSFNLRAIREDLLARIRDFAAAGGASPLDTLEAVRFAFAKLRLTDAAERQAQRLRPRETRPGATDQVLRDVLARIDALPPTGPPSLEAQGATILARFEAVPRDEDRPVVRVGIIGDPYTMLETFFNRGLEEELGRLGVEVHRWLYIGDLTRWDILAGLAPNPHGEPVREAAQTFVGRDIGGFGRMTVGHAVLFARAGFDGLVHLAPFECVPEVVAHNVLRRLQDEIPILSLTFDEQTARAGLVTRLEAFADMLHMRAGRGLRREIPTRPDADRLGASMPGLARAKDRSL